MRRWAGRLDARRLQLLQRPHSLPPVLGPPAYVDVCQCCDLLARLARMGEAAIFTAATLYVPPPPANPLHAAVQSWLCAISPGDV